MLFSMTGFGSGRAEANGIVVAVEIRSVNNRHLKVVVRGSDPYPHLESEFEKLIRQTIRRGTVTLLVRVQRPLQSGSLAINADAVAGYIQQLAPLAKELSKESAAALYSGVLSLPGVASEAFASQQASEVEWPIVERATLAAAKELSKMRTAEGRQMADELLSLIEQITERVQQVQKHLPAILVDYRKRLYDRISLAVSEAGVKVDESNLIREIALYADRTDVAEEITRITGHIAAVREVIASNGDGAGRRLEFLAQELGREVNTLGSKAGDAVISRHAIEMKAILEKFRELVLNVE